MAVGVLFMAFEVSNIFPTPSESHAGVEEFLTLVESANTRVERILSHGQASEKDFWYDQEEDEWVLLLRGEAVLEMGDGSLVGLTAGSHLMIPKHTRHRVERTTRETIWLAIFLKA